MIKQVHGLAERVVQPALDLIEAAITSEVRYRGTSPTRKRFLLGPYRRPIPRV